LKPTSPIISVAWLVGVLRNVPIRDSRAAIRWWKDEAEELMMNRPMLEYAVSRHRIIVSVQNPSRFLREVEARRAKYVYELVGVATDRFGRMNRRRRDDCDRWATAQFMTAITTNKVFFIGSIHSALYCLTDLSVRACLSTLQNHQTSTRSFGNKRMIDYERTTNLDSYVCACFRRGITRYVLSQCPIRRPSP